ncbi:class I SAM-dependent methyltransferase [Myxococcota bacterium]|nr:class I SAM-dependent methyltransferase [Myxococcota bacterium]MBU1412344.1 class I SAM-dependent methyltransferase [Myxococcota bacterium]MBU1508727.1 class I SAM-dependent methyltransferase [Myxococcota bacterium]
MSGSTQLEKMAKVYDKEIMPTWSAKFGKLLMRNVTFPTEGMVLDVLCGTGYPAVDFMRSNPDSRARIIAIDNVGPLLDEARKKAVDFFGKRLFFRNENPAKGLSFADEVYDLSYSNVGLMNYGKPWRNLIELSRVTRSSGTVAVTLPLSGSWMEFFDIYREILTKRDKYDLLKRLDDYEAAHYPTADAVIEWMNKAGLRNIKAETERFELLFKTGREFFYSSVVEYGPLPDWKRVIENPAEVNEVFAEINDAIDTHFRGLVFSVTIEAGCFTGQKLAWDQVVEDEGVLEEDDIEIIEDDED